MGGDAGSVNAALAGIGVPPEGVTAIQLHPAAPGAETSRKSLTRVPKPHDGAVMSTQYPNQPYAPTQPQPASIATASVVLGAVGFVVGICSVIGLILGLVARGKVKRGEISPARVTAGIVVSAVSLALGIIGWIVIFSLAAAGSSMQDTTSTSIAAPAVTAEEAPVVDQAPVEEPVAEPVVEEAPAPVEATEAAPAPAPVVEAPSESVAQKNAVRQAESYLEYSAFSRSGLIGQLEYEDYSTDDATYAVDHITVDWNVQAAKSAASYLEYSSFSRQGLIDQLVYEGFSASEAEFGVSQTGL